MTTDTPIALDANFRAINDISATRLQDRLQTDFGYTVVIDPPKRGLLRRSEP